jgi:hypothetical protein
MFCEGRGTNSARYPMTRLTSELHTKVIERRNFQLCCSKPRAGLLRYRREHVSPLMLMPRVARVTKEIS